MRDYDPTTGRYVQGDPLGLVDGASVYGYALQNPGRWVDFQGLEVVITFFEVDVIAFGGFALAYGLAQDNCGCGGEVRNQRFFYETRWCGDRSWGVRWRALSSWMFG